MCFTSIIACKMYSNPYTSYLGRTPARSSTSYQPFNDPAFASPLIMDLPFRTARQPDRTRDRHSGLGLSFARPGRHEYHSRYTTAAPRYFDYVPERGSRAFYEEEGYDDEYETAVSPPRFDRFKRHPVRDSRDSLSVERRSSAAGHAEYDKARHNLYCNLKATTEAIQEIIKGFENDTEQVRKYAGKRVLSELWKMKIGFSDDSDSIDDMGDIKQVLLCDYGQMNTMGTKLRSIMARVIQARIEVADEEKAQAASLQQKKIRTATVCIDGIWNEIQDSHKRCQDLVRELESLQKIVEPEESESGSNFHESNSGSHYATYTQ